MTSLNIRNAMHWKVVFEDFHCKLRVLGGLDRTLRPKLTRFWFCINVILYWFLYDQALRRYLKQYDTSNGLFLMLNCYYFNFFNLFYFRPLTMQLCRYQLRLLSHTFLLSASSCRYIYYAFKLSKYSYYYFQPSF